MLFILSKKTKLYSFLNQHLYILHKNLKIVEEWLKYHSKLSSRIYIVPFIVVKLRNLIGEVKELDFLISMFLLDWTNYHYNPTLSSNGNKVMYVCMVVQYVWWAVRHFHVIIYTQNLLNLDLKLSQMLGCTLTLMFCSHVLCKNTLYLKINSIQKI